MKKFTEQTILKFIFSACALMFFAASSEAAIFTVTRADDRNTTCVSGVDCSLREAIKAANSAPGDDTINFSIPANDPNCTGSGICTITLVNGELSIFNLNSDKLTITNSTGASKLLISGNNASRVFQVGSDLTLDGVTVTNGNGAGTRVSFNGLGGGIENNATLSITNSVVTNNSVSGYGYSTEKGGGIESEGPLTITNSVISNNTANLGGGIYNSAVLSLTNSTVSGNQAIGQGNGGGIYSSYSDLTLINTTVNGNSAGSGRGGGIYDSGGNNLTVTNSTISNNIGNGMMNRGVSKTTITSSTVSGNNETSLYGGGIDSNGLLTLTNSVVSNNTTTRYSGGGIYQQQNADLTLTNSTVSGNQAQDSGGGIYNSSSVTTLTNSTVSGNTAGTYGGGIFSGSTLNLTSVTVTSNQFTSSSCAANCSGGIFTYPTAPANLTNTIVAGNTAADSTASPDFSGAVSSTSSYNLIGNNQGMTGINNGTNGNQVGTPMNPIDPKLDTLKNNGGATQTHALLPGSPAIDQGTSTGSNGTDQRGSNRPVDMASIPNATGGDGADIGAFEVQAAPTATSVSISGQVITISGRGIMNVRLSLIDSNGQSRTATTNSFGYYKFDDVQTGKTYIIQAIGKHFTFNQPIQVLNVNEETNQIDFVANSEKRERVF